MQTQEHQFVVCVNNAGYPASLETGKIYRTLPDDTSAAHGLLRVTDESGEDYLYPAARFLPLELPPAVRDALAGVLTPAVQTLVESV